MTWHTNIRFGSPRKSLPAYTTLYLFLRGSRNAAASSPTGWPTSRRSIHLHTNLPFPSVRPFLGRQSAGLLVVMMVMMVMIGVCHCDVIRRRAALASLISSHLISKMQDDDKFLCVKRGHPEYVVPSSAGRWCADADVLMTRHVSPPISSPTVRFRHLPTAIRMYRTLQSRMTPLLCLPPLPPFAVTDESLSLMNRHCSVYEVALDGA